MADGSRMDTVSPITAAEIADEMWLEVARNHAVGAPMRQEAERARLTSTAFAPVEDQPLPLDALLALEGDAFVQAAYASILGRAPDDAGATYFASEMARGRNKVELLGGLQSSDEARHKGRVIPGLRRRYMVRRVYRLPVIGPGAKAGGAVLRRLGLSRALAGQPLGWFGSSSVSRRLAAFEAAMDTRRRALEERVAEQQTVIDLATRRLAQLQAGQDELGRKALSAIADQDRLLRTLTERSASLTRQLTATEDSIIESLLTLADSVADHTSRVTRLEQVVDVPALAARIDEVAGALRAQLDGRVIAAETIAEQNRRDVADQQRRIGLMLNALNAARAMGQGVPPAVEAEDDHALDALYVAFEDRFRGTRATIKQRQLVYLPRLRDAGAGTPDRPVLDIGAGRGEFLELLREQGLTGLGVDSNETMAAVCRDIGLDCVQADALDNLAARPANSLGAITGFHIIEHLPFKVTVRIIDEALRVLAPGGLLILETPNPANLLTASRWFYLDPTHRNPLPGEMVAMIAEARGFPMPEILELHPMAARFPGNDQQLAAALDKIFYGPQDYALIARKP